MLTKDHHCLESIIEAVDRIVEYTSGFNSADDFNNDYRNFDATMMNFVVIGEMVDKISDDFKNGHDNIEWIRLKVLEVLWLMINLELMLKRFGGSRRSKCRGFF